MAQRHRAQEDLLVFDKGAGSASVMRDGRIGVGLLALAVISLGAAQGPAGDPPALEAWFEPRVLRLDLLLEGDEPAASADKAASC